MLQEGEIKKVLIGLRWKLVTFNKKTIISLIACLFGGFSPWYNSATLNETSAVKILLIVSCAILAIAKNYKEDKNLALMSWLLFFSVCLNIGSTLVISRNPVDLLGLGSFCTIFNSIFLLFPFKNNQKTNISL